ncbi:hypothetical protein ABI59_23980 [Acidobacteria bacterium Mor1]|nr:hypothetical protein ABI59_23980 [Acidobacteria bacterium Mor1]
MTSSLAGDPIAERLSLFVADGWMPGAAWWVEREGRCLSRGAVGSLGAGEGALPARVETVYDLASLTKPLATGLCSVLAAQDGAFDLDRPLTEWLPELAGSGYEAVTAAEAAAHRGRLPAWAPLYADGSTRDSYLRSIARIPPVEPGHTVYSDLGYLLLGFALERASGQTLARIFAERVARPLDLDLGFGPVDPATAAPTEEGNRYEQGMARDRGIELEVRTHRLQGEVHDGNAAGLGGVAGHAGLFGTAAGVAAVAREILSPRCLPLSEASRQRLLQVGGNGRSFGFEAASSTRAARELLPDDSPGHTGFSGTSLWLVPARRVSLVLLSNRVHPEVQDRGFQAVRRAFHEEARVLAEF